MRQRVGGNLVAAGVGFLHGRAAARIPSLLTHKLHKWWHGGEARSSANQAARLQPAAAAYWAMAQGCGSGPTHAPHHRQAAAQQHSGGGRTHVTGILQPLGLRTSEAFRTVSHMMRQLLSSRASSCDSLRSCARRARWGAVETALRGRLAGRRRGGSCRCTGA